MFTGKTFSSSIIYFILRQGLLHRLQFSVVINVENLVNMINNGSEPMNEDRKKTLTLCHELLPERVGQCKISYCKVCKDSGRVSGTHS